MSTTTTGLYRSLHDVGLAAWFGGSLFGVLGLNAAATEAPDRLAAERVASIGWAKWSPANATAIAAHAVGGAGLVVQNRRRVRAEPAAARLAVTKAALTAAALGATAYARVLGKKIENEVIHRSATASSSSTSFASRTTTREGASTATGETLKEADKKAGQAVGAAADSLPGGVDDAERQLRTIQFTVPALTGAALVLGVLAGEQERPTNRLRAVVEKVGSAISSED